MNDLESLQIFTGFYSSEKFWESGSCGRPRLRASELEFLHGRSQRRELLSILQKGSG